MNVRNASRYHEVYARSMSDPDGFWREAARDIDWMEPPKKIFDRSLGLYGRWFPDAFVGTMGSVLDAVATGSIPRSSVADNVKTIELVAALYRSMESNEVVALGA